jgi:hypothetical protein
VLAVILVFLLGRFIIGEVEDPSTKSSFLDVYLWHF